MGLEYVALCVLLTVLFVSVQVAAAHRVGGWPLVLRVVPFVVLAMALASGVVAVGLSAIRPATGVPLAEGFGLVAVLLLVSSAALFMLRVIAGRRRRG